MDLGYQKKNRSLFINMHKQEDEDLEIQSSWERLYTHRGINPQGDQAHCLISCYVTCPRCCPYPRCLRLSRKQAVPWKQSPNSKKPEPWSLCSRMCLYHSRNKFGSSRQPSQVRREGVQYGLRKVSRPSPHSKLAALPCLCHVNTPMVNRNWQTYFSRIWLS